MKRFELSTLWQGDALPLSYICRWSVTSAPTIMHHGGAEGQFPRQASDDAGSDRPSDALDARRQLFDPGTQPPRGIESSPGQLPGPEL